MKTSATFFFITIEFDRVVVKFDGTHGGLHTRVVTSVRDLRDFLLSKADEAKVKIDDLIVTSSSTLDFPHEFTKIAETAALAHELRGSK